MNQLAYSTKDTGVTVPTNNFSSPSVDLLNQVLFQLEASVAIFDSNGKCSCCSPHLAELLGAAPATLHRFVNALTYDPQARETLMTQFALAQKGQEEIPAIEVPAIGKDDDPSFFEVRTSTLGNTDIGTLMVSVNRCSGESEPEQDRTQADRLAAIGRIAAGVAHEFNNIITAMIGWIQIAGQEGSSPEMVSSALEIVEQNAQRAKEIGFQLLDGARQEQEPLRSAVSLVEIVEDVLRLLSLEMGSANIQVESRFEDVEKCLIDKTRIWQVFVNLARNAMDAMPGGGKLQVAIEQRENQVATTFADNGVGISPEDQARVFEPFFTTKSQGQSSAHAGVGLGLSICRDIVQAHGGTIEVSGTEGGGTSFTVLLPVSTEERSEGASRRSRSSIPPGISILIVDDEPDIGDMMRTALELKSVSAVAVCSGQEALEQCREQRFDAAFIDFSMPGLSGKALGQEIHAVQPDLPIIFMSGREVEVSPDLNMADFLKKPFDIQEIQNKLHEVLER